MYSISPGFPDRDGVEIPTVYFLETVAFPWRYNEDVSTPFSEVVVILLLKITGPSNSEIIVPSGPPSTRTERLTETSSGVRTSNPILTPAEPKSSPVTEGIGASNTSS